MDWIAIQDWIGKNQTWALVITIVLSAVGYLIARFIIGRGLIYIAKRTKTKYDDIVVNHLRPFRVAWAAPLIVLYVFANLLPEYQVFIETTTLFLLLWVLVFTVNALLSALNDILNVEGMFIISLPGEEAGKL